MPALPQLRVSAPVDSSSGGSGLSDAEAHRNTDSDEASSDLNAADLTLEELERQRQNGALPPGGGPSRKRPQHNSLRSAAVTGGGFRPASGEAAAAGAQREATPGSGAGAAGRRFKRENKNRPAEASSRQRPKRLQEVVKGTKRDIRDPRFELLAGRLDEGRFRKQYAFLYDEALPQERSGAKAALKKVKDPGKAAELRAHLQRLDQQLAADAAAQRRAQLVSGIKAKERAAVKAGKKPFYLKKGELRKAELVEKYKVLSAAGPAKLEAALAKRRKKNAAKDHRYLPAARREG